MIDAARVPGMNLNVKHEELGRHLEIELDIEWNLCIWQGFYAWEVET